MSEFCAHFARKLKRLDPSKATGPDGIPARVLQQCASTLSLPLSRLFSPCFRYGVQPSMWKIANVVPIHKRHSRSEARNYRTVSLLSIMSKVMEKVINRSLMNHLEKKELLSAHQFGFRPGVSAADLLTSLNHQWQSCINVGGAVRVLAVDLAGAFDKVSHVGVLHKLRAYGIDGTLHRWLTSYLSNRHLQAIVGGATSQAFPVTADVPQGSILGPTLFIVYVNDAPGVLPANTVPATYADDTTLFSLIPSIDDVPARCTEFQSGVDALSEWGSTWRVKFEPSKSQATTISRHLRPWPFSPVKFYGVTVEEANPLRLLGVTFDKTLSLIICVPLQCMQPSESASCAKRLPFSTFPAGSPHTKALYAHSWSTVLLCGVGRLLAISHDLTGSSDIALSFLGPGVIVDSLELRRTISGLCLLYKLMCGPRSPCLLPLLPRQAHHTPHPRTQQQAQLSSEHNLQSSQTLPARSNNAILRSFPHASIKIWNFLPPSILHEQPAPSSPSPEL